MKLVHLSTHDVGEYFAAYDVNGGASGLSDSDRAILEAGPDCEGYWEAWDDCVSRVVVQSHTGQRYTLWRDGDLWLIPEGAEWADD
jgi:hypothetical protein